MPRNGAALNCGSFHKLPEQTSEGRARAVKTDNYHSPLNTANCPGPTLPIIPQTTQLPYDDDIQTTASDSRSPLVTFTRT